MSKVILPERNSELNGSFPVRAPVWWGRRGENEGGDLAEGTTGRFVVLAHHKKFRRFEGIIARMLRAPRTLRRPLDDMNSYLWELCDGQREFEEIVSLMDARFDEKVAPASDRCEAALKQLGEKGFIVFSKRPFEGHWDLAPGIDPAGIIEDIEGLDSN